MIVGIDFGTSNSLVTYIEKQGGERASHLLQKGQPHPSLVWYEAGQITCGQPAKEQLRTGSGLHAENIVKSPKLLLGRSIPVRAGGEDRSPSQVASELLKYLKDQADGRISGQSCFHEAVITIPVTMQGPGRKALREAAMLAGIEVVQFVHEPLAALYAYFRRGDQERKRLQALENQVVLVFDWGGGTLDMTLVRILDGRLCQILNHGLETVGGDVFDRNLMVLCRSRFLDKWKGADAEILQGREEVLLDQCEQAKIRLSSCEEVDIFVGGFARVDGKARNLETTLTREDLEDATRPMVNLAIRELNNLLDRGEVAPGSVALCLATGGMCLMPAIYDRLVEIFDALRVPKPTAIGSATLISEGAAWIAHDKSRLTLSKPFELEMVHRRYLPLIEEGELLPVNNGHWSLGAPRTVYCTDPTDGTAKFIFTRPRWPGYSKSIDARDVYKEAFLRVDSPLGRMFQRLNVEILIDGDLVLTAVCTSLGLDYQPFAETRVEIHDLEFGIQLPRLRGHLGSGSDSGQARENRLARPDKQILVGGIALKANISDSNGNYADAPGDVVERFHPGYFDPRIAPATLADEKALRMQKRERDYYFPFGGMNRPMPEAGT